MTISNEAMSDLRNNIIEENSSDDSDEFEYDGTPDYDDEYYDGEDDDIEGDSDNDVDNDNDEGDVDNNSDNDGDDSSDKDDNDDNDDSGEEDGNKDGEEDGDSDDDGSSDDDSHDESNADKIDVKKSRTQKRIEKLVAEREEARANLRRLEREYNSKNNQAVDSEGNPVQDNDALVEPDEDDFDDYESYSKAYIDYSTKKAMEENRDRNIESQYQDNINREAEIVSEQFKERSIAAQEAHEDFVEVVSNPDLQITPSMVYVMADSEIGGEIAYYLGKHPEEAARISVMPESLMGRAITSIESKLSKPIKKTVNKPAPTTGKRARRQGGGRKSPERMSTAEYIMNRRKNINR